MLRASGAGGDNEVTFRLNVETNPAAARAFQDLERQAVRTQSVVERSMQAGGGAAGGSILGGIRQRVGNNPAAMMAELENMRYQSQSVHERVTQNIIASGNARSGAIAARGVAYQRRANDYWQNDPSMQGRQSYQPGNWHGGDERETNSSKLGQDARTAISGVTDLARSFVYLGVASEENLAKAVRALAKMEAAAAGVRGAMSIGRGIQGMASAMSAGGGLAMSGGLAGGAIGVAAVAGLAGIGYLNSRRQSQIDAEAEQREATQQRFRDEARDRLSSMDAADAFATNQSASDARGFRREGYEVQSMGRRGDRAELDYRFRQSQQAVSTTQSIYGNDDQSANGRVEQELRQQLQIAQEIGRIDADSAREKLIGAQQVTRELESQVRIEEQKLRIAESDQKSGAAAYGSMTASQRARFNSAYEAHQRGETLGQRQIDDLQRGDADAAYEASARLGNARGYGDTRHGQDAAVNVGNARASATGARASADAAAEAEKTAAQELQAVQTAANAKVDGIMQILFDTLDRIETQARDREAERGKQQALQSANNNRN
jgi:hypothetical protein